MKKRVLITGASGFIGSKLLIKFKNDGYEVIGWDRTEVNESEVPVTFVDMSTKDSIVAALLKCNPDIVIHCAGSADVGKSVANPEIDYEGNVTLTHNLLFAMHKCGLEKKRFVFLSSAGVYGNPISLPITEDIPVNPLSPYALHKVMCEDLCRYFIKNYRADIKIARIFSAYGAGLRKQIFWDMHNKVVNAGKLDMFGTGNESRDYIHVTDVVKSIYLLATEDSEFDVFNVANGEETTIRSVTEYFAKYSNLPNEKIHFNGVVREGDPLNWKADIQRISSLGYEKSVSIEDGIKDYTEWCKNQ